VTKMMAQSARLANVRVIVLSFLGP